MRIRSSWFALVILIAGAIHSPASAGCTLPYTLTNGQTADASQVMANLNAVIACMGTTTGTFVNKFRNGTMDIWQRGASGTSTTTSGPTTQTGPDGWYIVPTGANVAWSRTTGRGPTVYGLTVTGATSVTDVTVKQRIESYVAAPLEGQTVTVQAEIFNGTGASITPTLTVKHASSADSWSSSVTDVNAVALQPVGNGLWVQVAYTFTASTASGNGLEISFDFGNNLSSGSQSVHLTEVDIRATPGVATGLNNTPPAPELRPIETELAFCSRYFYSTYQNAVPGTSGASGFVVFPTGTTIANDIWYSTERFPVPMRISPAVTVYGFQGNAGQISAATEVDLGANSATVGAPSVNGFGLYNSNGSTINTGGLALYQYIASAEL
jgi:hypothetical protein